MAQPKLSVVIILKNEVDFIEDCLKSCLFADEIILIDGGSTDGTLTLARKYPVRIISQQEKSLDFAAWHNQGQAAAKHAWVFFLDADERFSPELVAELRRLPTSVHAAYAVPRFNYLLNKKLLHGGWYPDYQIRLVAKAQFKSWVGKLHEHPDYTGTLGYLHHPLIHLQPAKLEPALAKSITWSKIEANLFLAARHPEVAWWRVLRMGLSTLYQRLVKLRGYQDGVEGWIESCYQAWHTMMVYLRLWELQKP